ncbi:hypothetical protein ES703_86439 [subsurface metagenome]
MTVSADSRHRTPHVPGQYLGYSLQTTRFLVHLLEADPGWTVSLEVFEDVGVETTEGKKIAEQAKSTLTGNPVSYRAIDFWKTISNWVDSAKSGELNPETTRFELYVSHPQKGEIVENFSKAKSNDEASAALINARNTIWGPSPTFPLKSALTEKLSQYVDKVFQADEGLICSIISNFQFEFGSGSPQDDLKAIFTKKMKFVGPEIVDDALDYALGWVKEKTDRLLEQKKPACITVDSFETAVGSFIRKHDRRTILRTFASIPSDQKIEEDLKVRTYVRQLDLIEVDDELKIKAVTDFLQSSVDRTQWSTRGLVHESSFDEFEDILVRTWNNHKIKTDIKLAGSSDIQRGQYLYADCSCQQVKLENLEVPPHFTPGSFHALA